MNEGIFQERTLEEMIAFLRTYAAHHDLARFSIVAGGGVGLRHDFRIEGWPLPPEGTK